MIRAIPANCVSPETEKPCQISCSFWPHTPPCPTVISHVSQTATSTLTSSSTNPAVQPPSHSPQCHLPTLHHPQTQHCKRADLASHRYVHEKNISAHVSAKIASIQDALSSRSVFLLGFSGSNFIRPIPIIRGRQGKDQKYTKSGTNWFRAIRLK